MKDGNPDCFLLCNVLNLSYAVMNKKKKDSFIDVMCSAILDYNVSLLADLHELNLGREIFIQHLCTNLIANALVAHHLLTKMEEKERNADKLKKIGKYKDKYQNASTEVLKNCYIESSQSTKHVLVEKVPYWSNKSSMSVARTTENEVFLNQEACRELNEHLWSSYNGNGKQFYKIGYMLFMMVYSVLLVSQLNQANINVLEFVVIVYTLILFIREFDQWCYQEEKPKNVPKTQIKQKKSSFLSKEYLLDPFNMLDNLSLVVAAIGWSLRWLAFYNPDNEGLMEGTRYLLSFNFAIYSIRFLEFFYTSQSLGPILVFIVNMLSIFIRYILIICVFLVSFSVASESLLHQEKTLNVDSFNEVFCIFKRGFWSTIGEYFLDEIHPSDANDFATKARKYVVLGLLGFYALFIQILLFNLVISLFGEEIENRRSKWDAISNFLRLKQIMQYSTIRFLLPPFLPLTIFLFFRSKDPYIYFVIKPQKEEKGSSQTKDLGRVTPVPPKSATVVQKIIQVLKQKRGIGIFLSYLTIYSFTEMLYYIECSDEVVYALRNPTPGNETAVPNQSDKTAVCQMPGSRNTLNVEPVQRRNAQPNRQLGPAELNWQQLFNENIKQIALRMREIVYDQSDSDNDDYNDNVEYNNC
ncbi:hypothetical protein Btru_019929 [Bulinus truncatus]|nr:hypothetical protein Btru_019929 [Bulinus truncatus]